MASHRVLAPVLLFGTLVTAEELVKSQGDTAQRVQVLWQFEAGG